MGIDVSDTTTGRADDRRWPTTIRRAVALDDLDVRAGRVHCDTCGNDATGRVIDAYAARFGEEAEINDESGHYIEDIDPAAWNRRLDHLSRSAGGLGMVGVFYHHGLTLHGTPSDTGAYPVGHPLAIRADGKGLLTATHYGRTAHADTVFTDLIDGNVRGHSFTGRIYRSDPDRVPRVNRGGSLPKVRRLELGLGEYGPTPLPYYEGAQLVGQRARSLGAEADELGEQSQQGDDHNTPVAGLSWEDTTRRIRLARLTGRIS
jgi:hypothetical protein